MIIEFGTPEFNEDWLNLLKQDPIHPTIDIEKRITHSRTVVMLVEENIPQAAICIKIGEKLPQNMNYILADEQESNYPHRERPLYAIFYSIFRLKDSTLKGAGAIAIKEAKKYFKIKGIKRFYTLSPIPNLTKDFKNIPSENEIIKYLLSGIGPVSKFHMGNGAEIHAINFNADKSQQRIFESWGIMVNYDYSDYA
jgi:malonyl-CoA decarboxylase